MPDQICERFDRIKELASQEPDYLLNEIVLSTIEEFSIDESHGLQHHQNVVYFLKQIMPEEWSDHQKELARICAHVHDLVDSKYQADKNLPRLLKFLKDNFPLSPEDIETISFVITHISFSKRRKNLEEEKSEFGTNDQFRIQICQVVADADMMDAYDPRRAEEYQTIKFAFLNDDKERQLEIVSWCRTIFEKRVLQYLATWLRTEKTKELAYPFHEEATEYCQKHYTNGQLRDY